MKLSLITKIRLFRVNLRREHVIIYSFVYYVYLIGAIFLLIISSGYFFGIADFATPEDAYEMFSYGAWYIIIVEIIIPVICGLKKWKKYLFPGTYKTITNKMAKEILRIEEFKKIIPDSDKRKDKQFFLESDNYFCFNGQLIPKNEIEEFDYNSYESKEEIELNFLLKNGSFVKNVYRETDAKFSIYKNNPVTDYLLDYFEKSGYKKTGYYKYRKSS